MAGRLYFLSKSFVGVWACFSLADEPHLYFMHFWANDDAVKLAQGLKAALAQINIAKS